MVRDENSWVNYNFLKSKDDNMAALMCSILNSTLNSVYIPNVRKVLLRRDFKSFNRKQSGSVD